MNSKALMLPFLALLLFGCGGGLNDEQREAAEAQADQLCEIKQLEPTTFKYMVQAYKIAIGNDDGSTKMAIVRHAMKLAKQKGCVS